MRSYIKLDASFFRHPKAVAAGRDGRDLFIAGLCYAGDLLTDGFIPAGAVPALAAEAGIKNGPAAARALTMVGLWETCAGGYQAHDYDEYNTRATTVRAKRDAAKERMRDLRSQDVRANNERTNANVLAREKEKEKERSYEPNGSTERTTSDAPWDLVESLCSAIGTNATTLTRQDKGKQLAAAKRLVENQATAAEIQAITAWLLGQSWITGGVDLLLIEKQLGKWRLNGRPGAGSEKATRLQLPPGFRLPEGFSLDKLHESLAYRQAGRSMHIDRETVVDAYLTALNGVGHA